VRAAAARRETAIREDRHQSSSRVTRSTSACVVDPRAALANPSARIVAHAARHGVATDGRRVGPLHHQRARRIVHRQQLGDGGAPAESAPPARRTTGTRTRFAAAPHEPLRENAEQ
jgi:hypothetical protein